LKQRHTAGRIAWSHTNELGAGSYPFFDPQHGANTNVVLRAEYLQQDFDPFAPRQAPTWPCTIAPRYE
jgi:hypothetical protein